ncbi:MAG: hypothetical protein LM517_02670 [Nitrosomonas sp.]|nr:hypothetical protein [Nitrosomonas sp.]
MQTMKIIFFFCFIAVLAGCATKPISSFQTISDVQISLNDSDEDQYRLVDKERRTVSISNGKNKILNFQIPKDIPGDQCFSVLDKNDKNFLTDKPRFHLSLVHEYRDLILKQKLIEGRVDWHTKEEQKYRKLHSETLDALSSNRAFINNSCYLPKQGELPDKPLTVCDSHDNCLEKGREECKKASIIMKICTIFSGAIGGNQLFARPLCMGLIKRMTDKDYEIRDVFDEGFQGLKTDFLRTFFGAPYTLYNISEYIDKFDETITHCSNNFVETNFYDPINRWKNTVSRIEAEPYETRNACLSLENDIQQYIQKSRYHENIKKSEINKLGLLNIEIDYIVNKKSELTSCGQ